MFKQFIKNLTIKHSPRVWFLEKLSTNRIVISNLIPYQSIFHIFSLFFSGGCSWSWNQCRISMALILGQHLMFIGSFQFTSSSIEKLIIIYLWSIYWIYTTPEFKNEKLNQITWTIFKWNDLSVTKLNFYSLTRTV